jgi:hemerythrin-like domain-containing protein
MMEDHKHVRELLKEIKSKRKPPKELFHKLRNEIVRHMVVEENTVFTLFNPKNKEDYIITPTLIRQHKEMLEALDEAEKSINKGWKPDFFKFDFLFDEHVEFEETSFYPRLDRTLDHSQKMKVIERMKRKI